MTDSLQPASAGPSRLYAGESDLPLLYRFASRSLAERFPLNATWHPGDIAWEMVTDGRNPPRNALTDIRLWFRDGELAALAWFYGDDLLYFEIVPSLGDEALLREIIAWGEANARARPLHVNAMDGDGERTGALAALGFRRIERGGICSRRDLSLPILEAPLPDGFCLRDCVDIDFDARALCHREAWSHLEEIGIFGAASRFSIERYRNVRAASVYDPRLDIVIEAPDGRLVANCICWADEASGIGAYEPVGTAYGFRRRGFARAVILEGARRLKAMGMRWARVDPNLINTPAQETYNAAGFTAFDTYRQWVKEA